MNGQTFQLVGTREQGVTEVTHLVQGAVMVHENFKAHSRGVCWEVQVVYRVRLRL